MTQIEILLALEKSNLEFKELMKITGHSWGATARKLRVLKNREQVILVRDYKSNTRHYEITDKGRERLEKMRGKK